MVQNYASHINEDFHAIGCFRLVDCFIDLFNQGFRQGGGIGDIMDFLSHSDKDYWGTFLYQMLFFFIINVIFLNIIFGVIIDTFAELREESKAREGMKMMGLNDKTYFAAWFIFMFGIISVMSGLLVFTSSYVLHT